jgi:hypothetical protein
MSDTNWYPDERWVDAHSVTCAICGALADERETFNLYEQENSRLEGEAHRDCWESHECLADGRFAPARDTDREADIDPDAGSIELPIVCKVCGTPLQARYSVTAVADPDEHTFHALPSIQLETHTQTLHGVVQRLANTQQIDPEEVGFLHDNIRALRDRLKQHVSTE